MFAAAMTFAYLAHAVRSERELHGAGHVLCICLLPLALVIPAVLSTVGGCWTAAGADLLLASVGLVSPAFASPLMFDILFAMALCAAVEQALLLRVAEAQDTLRLLMLTQKGHGATQSQAASDSSDAKSFAVMRRHKNGPQSSIRSPIGREVRYPGGHWHIGSGAPRTRRVTTVAAVFRSVQVWLLRCFVGCFLILPAVLASLQRSETIGSVTAAAVQLAVSSLGAAACIIWLSASQHAAIRLPLRSLKANLQAAMEPPKAVQDSLAVDSNFLEAVPTDSDVDDAQAACMERLASWLRRCSRWACKLRRRKTRTTASVAPVPGDHHAVLMLSTAVTGGTGVKPIAVDDFVKADAAAAEMQEIRALCASLLHVAQLGFGARGWPIVARHVRHSQDRHPATAASAAMSLSETPSRPPAGQRVFGFFCSASIASFAVIAAATKDGVVDFGESRCISHKHLDGDVTTSPHWHLLAA